MLAHANGERLRLSEPGEWREKIYDSTALEAGKNSNAAREGLPPRWDDFRFGEKQPFGVNLLAGNDWDEYAAFFHRVDNGVQNRGNRIRGLGNAVVPIQTREAFKKLIGAK